MEDIANVVVIVNMVVVVGGIEGGRDFGVVEGIILGGRKNSMESGEEMLWADGRDAA